MTEEILSVGIDLGTSTTQMIVSRLQLQNTASAFAVPHMEITKREILYESPIHFTPLLSADRLDGEAIGRIIAGEYEKAGIQPQQVQTGAVIITGETARKENARQVLEHLSHLAGDFVVATAGPALESVLAARGAGADLLASRRGRPVIHVDIGGGTANLAVYDREGKLLDTGCVNVGGRLMKFTSDGQVTYVSPVLEGLAIPSGTVTPDRLQPILQEMVQVLEEAVGLCPRTGLSRRWITDKLPELPEGRPILSFSGGVADLIDRQEDNWLRYGDLGVLLGRAIRQSALCRGDYVLGSQTIRATVVGAGSHATELSGSTVYVQGASFPVQNLPAVTFTAEEQQSGELPQLIKHRQGVYGDEPAALIFPGLTAPSYQQVQQMAEAVSAAAVELPKPLVIAMEADMAKALGQALTGRLGKNVPLICLDGLHVPEGSYLDVAAPVAGATAVPVVVKTLAFSK